MVTALNQQEFVLFYQPKVNLRAGQMLADCERLGVSFSLDDFDTGYSSLTYLKHLPVKEIKIDQRIEPLATRLGTLRLLAGSRPLRRHLCRAYPAAPPAATRARPTEESRFKRQVIAEGVETPAHSESLLQLDCELVQGYGIARPMPAADLPRWVANFESPAQSR